MMSKVETAPSGKEIKQLKRDIKVGGVRTATDPERNYKQ